MKSNISNNLIFELKQLIEKEEIVFAYFSANWCGECKMSNLVFDKLKLNYADKISFLKIDVDEEKLWDDDENKFFKVEKVPTFLIYKNKKENNRYFNFKTIDFHQNQIRKLLNI
ncbi:MAG: thioredoxin [Candidatus Hepatoplasma scabrum]|nr:MAG: thioredoxin [Candidatus Hepatoplasma sp.]